MPAHDGHRPVPWHVLHLFFWVIPITYGAAVPMLKSGGRKWREMLTLRYSTPVRRLSNEPCESCYTPFKAYYRRAFLDTFLDKGA